jgi:hypothetical protein
MPTKTFKSDADSTAGIVASKNAVRMNGKKDHYVMADERGVTVNGPISFVSGSAQMRYGGLWTMNTELMLSLPSTMATPTPVMTINPPVKQFKSLMEEAAVMIGLFGAI